MTDFQIVREYIASGNAQALDAMINGQQWERHFDTVHNAFAYIKKLPLFDAFGLTKSIHCLFHPDKHASANFFCGRNGEYLYHCFSPNCALNKAVSIIGFVRTIQGSTDNRAFRFLAKVCHVTWENRCRDTEDFIAHNRKFLANLPQNCPTAWPILRSHIAVLEALYRCLEEDVPFLLQRHASCHRRQSETDCRTWRQQRQDFTQLTDTCLFRFDISDVPL